MTALAGRWPSNRVLVVALAAFCIVNVGSALSPVYSVLLITRIVAACSAALCSPLTFALAVTLAPPEKKGRALSLVMIGGTVAIVMGGPLGSWIGGQWGWRISLGAVAAAAGVACLGLLIFGLPRSPASHAEPLTMRLAPLREPRILLALAPILFVGIGFHAIYTYIAPLLQHNLQIRDISEMLVAIGLGSGLGSWLGGGVADRFGMTRSAAIILWSLIIVESMLPFATSSFVGAWLSLMAFGAAMPCFIILQQHRILSIAPKHANVIMGLNSAITYLGMAIGAALGGSMMLASSAKQLGWISALCTLVAFAILYPWSKRQGN